MRIKESSRGVLERTLRSNEKVLPLRHYKCIKAGSELVCQCQVHFLEDVHTLLHTPWPVVNVIHYKLSGLHHNTEPERPGTACPAL